MDKTLLFDLYEQMKHNEGEMEGVSEVALQLWGLLHDEFEVI